jgi:c-di-GMP-binding flagellar brake protein YcgR
MTEERRKSRRVSAESLVWYEVKDIVRNKQEHQEVDIGTPLISVDISIGGAQVVTNKKLKPDAILKVIISPENNKLPIVILARVAWSKPGDKQNEHKVGLEFTEFINGRKAMLEKYIEMH